MELNGMINKFLVKNPETRRRALQIRTYVSISIPVFFSTFPEWSILHEVMFS